MRALKIIAIFVAGIALWFWVYPAYHHRYKMTVEIEIGNELKVGSGIIDVWHYTQPLERLVGGALSHSLKGRSAVVDLGGKGIILGLVSTGVMTSMDEYSPRPHDGRDIALCAYYGPKWDVDPQTRKSIFRKRLKTIKNERGLRELDSDCYPAFVWLPDSKNREPAVPAPPGRISEIIKEAVTIRSVKIEITTEHLSDQIYKQLPWLAELEAFEQKQGSYQSIRDFKINAAQILGGPNT